MPVDFGEIKRTDFLRQAVKVLVAGFPLSQGCTNKLAVQVRPLASDKA